MMRDDPKIIIIIIIIIIIVGLKLVTLSIYVEEAYFILMQG